MEENPTTRDGSDFLKTDRGKTRSASIEIPSISLPGGGGAIKGIDEKFTVNAVNGTSSFSVPLPVSAARGVTPGLSLSYDSGSGNGIAGLGWSIPSGSVKRKTDKGLPRYLDNTTDDDDIFLLAGAEDLVPEYKKAGDGSFPTGPGGNFILNEYPSDDGQFIIRTYRPRIEGSFAKIERWQSKTGNEIKWKITTRENEVTLLGWNAGSRIADPADPGKIFEWLPEFVFDDKGNCCRYIYKMDDKAGFDPSLAHNRNRLKNDQITYAGLYLEMVLYGNRTPYKKFGDPFPAPGNFLFSTVFDYGEYDRASPFDKVKEWDFRPDAFSTYRAGFEIRTTRLCKRVMLYHHFTGAGEYSGLVRSLDFEYESPDSHDFMHLRSITSTGYIKNDDGSYSVKKLPPVEFDYSVHDWNDEIRTISEENIVHAPGGVDEMLYKFTDLFNEGLSGILTEQAGGWYYKQNLGGGQFDRARLISPKPSFTGLGGQVYLADLDGDGVKQLVSLENEPKGYFELDDMNRWQNFRNFGSLPNTGISGPDTRMFDLDGDGRAEIVTSQENGFTWYESKGREGFSAARKTTGSFDEEAGPRIVFSETAQTIFLADMSGDGLTDIVRIRNGEVCYWPNIGYGHFGAKVTMDNAPLFDHPAKFNARYIRLADIDGSGTTDIIYLGKNQFTCWINHSGNSFDTSPFQTAAFPAINDRTSITMTDLLGNGVACIVWSTPMPDNSHAPLRYIDLMNSRKPHLMVSYKNNLGKEVRLEYTPSTRFYTEDRDDGRPWVTRLHFPVHCVSLTETLDRITGYRFVSLYRYRHGYYDHDEREFRGFGMVEQTDTEHFENRVKGNASDILDRELDQEPVVSRTWFHTGAGDKNGGGSYSEDYWYKEMERLGFTAAHNESGLQSPITTIAPGLISQLPSGLTPLEKEQAIRACKGSIVRSELFARDASAGGDTPEAIKKQATPYTVTSSNSFVEMIQPKGSNKHAVFIVRESESLAYNYERDPSDPRISHKLNISSDEYGNILESASVVYPRLVPDNSLPPETRQEQGKTVIIHTRNRYTNDVISPQAYRLRLPSESETHELKGVAKPDNLYRIEDFNQILDDANSTTAQYHEAETPLSPGKAQKRLIEHTRSVWYRDDLTGPLPLHNLESLGLPCENYQLAFTPGLIQHIYQGGQVNDPLMTESRFVHSEGDNNWWIPSGRAVLLNTGENAADAAGRFFTPAFFTDPFGAVTRVTYYGNYFLFIQQIENAIGNRTIVEKFNFRTMAPAIMKDMNGNLSAALADELGFIKAIALSGKGVEADELTGLTETTNAAETALARNFLNAADSSQLSVHAGSLLQRATTRFIYDFESYRASGKPAVVASIVREQHYHENQNSPLQVSFEYTGGMGEVVMKKVQAEPGMAKKVTVNPDDTYTVADTDTAALNPRQLRWTGTGRVVHNNKGNPVKQYEPYFSVNFHYEDQKELVESGVTPIMYYDAPGRLVKTEMPDGTFTRVEFNSWKQVMYDAGDTVTESTWYNERVNRLADTRLTNEGKDPAREEAAAGKSAIFAGTPGIQHFDTLGRAVLSVEHSRNTSGGADEFYLTRATLDPEGSLRKVTDARGNTVMEYEYDMLGNLLSQNGMDSGRRLMFNNIAGKPVRNWDERGHEFRHSYDILQRTVQTSVHGGDGSAALNNIFEKIVYGEDLLLPGRSNEAQLQADNVLGQTVRHFDTGGVVETPKYTFKGLPLFTTRKLFKRYRDTANWIDANLSADLENEEFTFSTQTDALGRITRQTAPDGSIITPGYNEAGLLESETILHAGAAAPTIYIKNIDYNEKGQRSRITYGNDVTTRLYFDRETFRLNRLETKRQNGDPLQDWHYTYDPAGNITHLEDKNIPVVFFDNQKITGISEYTYDALYRLTQAKGRENDAPFTHGSLDNWNDSHYMHSLSPGDPMSIRNYTQTYKYDGVGNMLEVHHNAAGNTWTRDYNYQNANNRLISTKTGSHTYSYPHHQQHGFITAMPHLEDIGWSFREEISMTVRQRRTDGGTPETTYYQYDSQGNRLRKITDNTAGAGADPQKKEERIYIAGYEVYRKHTNSHSGLERVSLSLLDQGHRFVMIETRNDVDDGTRKQLTRYQHHNHLGSSSLELDQNAAVISYEEYHPYGTTAYQARNAAIRSAAKRYRYTGMERDEESGLSYHSARYYLPWLGRWMSPDPVGLADGVNRYRYAGNNPVLHIDSTGYQSIPSQYHPDPMYQLARGFGMMFEFAVGGRADPARDKEPSMPEGGVGGLVGGYADTLTLRQTDILEDNPTAISQAGMETGAGMVPYANSALELYTGESVTGRPVNRYASGAMLLLELAPTAVGSFALARRAGIRPIHSIRRNTSADYRVRTDVRERAEAIIRGGELNKKDPFIAGVYEPSTGKTYFGRNDASMEIHPVLEARLKKFEPFRSADNPNYYHHPGQEHAEINAINEALWARTEKLGTLGSEDDLAELILHVERLKLPNSGAAGPRCSRCSFVSEDLNVTREVRNAEREQFQSIINQTNGYEDPTRPF